MDSNENSTDQQLVMDPHTKAVVKNVLKNCKKEQANRQIIHPLFDFFKRASIYTGVTVKDLHMIYKEVEESSNNSKSHLDIFEKVTIAMILLSFHNQRREPEILEIYKQFQTLQPLYSHNLSHFEMEILSLGYEYHTSSKAYGVIREDPVIMFNRYLFLKNIFKAKEDERNIYYIDERVIDTSQTFEKPLKMQLHNSSNDATSLFIFYLMTDIGIQNVFYCSKLTKEDFWKWLTLTVLPELQPVSVIVIDDNFLHGKVTDTISPYQDKAYMLQWLRKHNVPCSAKMHKAELYKLIDKCEVKADVHSIESMLTAYGHEVLRLPNKLQDLTPCTLLWTVVREKFEDDPVEGIAELKQNVNDYIKSLVDTQWSSFHSSIDKICQQLKNIDEEFDN